MPAETNEWERMFQPLSCTDLSPKTIEEPAVLPKEKSISPTFFPAIFFPNSVFFGKYSSV